MPIKIAALQMVSTPDVGRNLEAAAALIAEAAAAGAALVALPEYFCLLGRRDTDKLAVAEAPGEGPIQAFLAQAARRHGLYVLGGTLPVKLFIGSATAGNNTLAQHVGRAMEAHHYPGLQLNIASYQTDHNGIMALAVPDAMTFFFAASAAQATTP